MREREVGRVAAYVLALAVIAVSGPGVVAEQAAAPAPAKTDKADKTTTGKKEPLAPLTLSGCVARGDAPNEYTIDDQSAGKYRVSGGEIKRYVGQHVEVVGTLDTARLKVRGGLYPSPNAAGQAGAMDPVKSAMAAQPGGAAKGTGDVDLPMLKVKSVKSLGGGCR